ncbi:hypothetical protein O7626_40815 [Micromonospora sp. WMMD1102]|uniref:hypothetical protein n=1 Tax=Micromonospora sp. WMMD1102 TaxID=3016105 RepID=UPI0024157807|nr:hypothetical protein [Micromonospora sp. WMMD1102]MDG4790344.1 hypothetical protein [Micromonospora sp. WMMD1102]MDG4792147.1 hypothetical protein [Micromonospora sp. WMMD1102]
MGVFSVSSRDPYPTGGVKLPAPRAGQPSLHQEKTDDRGQGVTADRLVDHAAALAAGHAITFSKPDLDVEAWHDAHPEQTGDRPSWMTVPDRPWCCGIHNETDKGDDRMCARTLIEGLPLRAMPPIPADAHMPRPCPATLSVEVWQMPGAAEPMVILSASLGHWEHRSLRLTVGEAVDLAGKILRHVEWGEQPLPLSPPPAGSPSWQKTACPVWADCDHRETELVGDRFHRTAAGSMVKVDLSLDGFDSFVEVSLVQDEQSAESKVELSHCDRQFADLLTGEARMLAANLLRVPALIVGGAR